MNDPEILEGDLLKEIQRLEKIKYGVVIHTKLSTTIRALLNILYRELNKIETYYIKN